ncbi:MAG TPA: bifunctional UDP-3-O-[3-hydroxymyristoyl] N-acetylglucosamine deacetylase/3-hydroxyacyl-ACP dehydratase [Saprospiraceae bacterium]|nr:bifunctional UDP-3-O-[3-hydroxymyristoyl] N-acetylglucosamine deacetylase/3-hydroxyacyl-ACP dehydratase [Saprospiraceae bacterium]
MKKKTLKEAIEIEGIGLHTAKHTTVKIKPQDTGGIKFKRTDLSPEVIIAADPAHVTKTSRSTTIEQNEASITTIEHLMAALRGMGVDNALIEVDNEEIPILDGSAKFYVDKINAVGLVELSDDIEEFIIEEPISLRDESTGSEIIALPSDKYELHVIIDFPGAAVDEQTAGIHNLADFETEIAPCRTFVFTNELEHLLAHNLIKGGDLSNALVISEKGMTQEKLDNLTSKFGLPSHRINPNGIINNTELHFNNELARHKLLDLIGDLALVGKHIKGKIIAIKPGHKINTDFARILKKKALEQRKLKGIPLYDPDQTPIMDIEKVKSLLPHRYPFLMVDKIIEMSPNHVVGVKNVTVNEAFFQGHFPENPVFPGVLQMEALAQTGGILALSNVEEPKKWDTYFLKMDNVKFKAKVVPGDTLLLKMELLTPIRRGIVHMQGSAYVGSKLVSEGELIAQIIKRPE